MCPVRAFCYFEPLREQPFWSKLLATLWCRPSSSGNHVTRKTVDSLGLSLLTWAIALLTVATGAAPSGNVENTLYNASPSTDPR